MGLLNRMFRLLSVIGQTSDDRAGDRRPLQLKINEANRDLEHARRDGSPAPGPIIAHIEQMEAALVERNVHGQDLEKQDQADAAIALYEANVDDMFNGSHPYERLLIIYTLHGAEEDAQRIARACLVHCNAGMNEKLRARCLKVLGIEDGQP